MDGLIYAVVGALLLPAWLIVVLRRPFLRFCLVCGLAMVTFTPGLAPFTVDAAYAVTLVAGGVAALADSARGSRRVRPSAISVVGPLTASYLVLQILNGLFTDAAATIRLGLPFLTLLVIFPIAVSAGRVATQRSAEALLATVTFLGAVSFCVYWLSARGVSALSTHSLFAASNLLPMLGTQWGMVSLSARGASLRRRVAALACGFGIPAMMLLTGTRTWIVVIGVCLVSTAVGAIAGRLAGVAGLMRLCIGISVSVAAIVWLGGHLITNADFLSERTQSLLSAWHSQGRADASVSARFEANRAAEEALSGHWLFGRGIAFPNPITPFDTPLSSTMRVGVVGTVLIVAFVILAVGARRHGGRTIGRLPLVVTRTWLVAVAALCLVLDPLGDAMFPVTVGLAITYAVASAEVAGNDRALGAPEREVTDDRTREVSRSDLAREPLGFGRLR